MGGEVRHEFYDRHFVVFVANGKSECYPHGRADDEDYEQKHGPPRCPVERASPEFLEEENGLLNLGDQTAYLKHKISASFLI